MPIQYCEIDGHPGYKWGESGKCYTFDPEDGASVGRARSRASAQGVAAYYAGYREDINPRVNMSLKRYVKSHNDAVGKGSNKSVTLPTLRQVWLKGMSGSSSAPGLTRSQSGFARVRDFLKKLKRPSTNEKAYKMNDLVPTDNNEGYSKLYEGNWGMRFVALRHTLGDMLHFYMAKEISDDDVAAAYIEDIGGIIDAAKKMPEHGEAAKTSFYQLMSLVAQSLQAWRERDPETAGGQMFYSLRMVQDRFEEKYGQDAPPSHREAVEDPTASQRKDLPAAAFEPSAFFSEDGEFRRSLSKLPHHINTAEDPNDNETVDVPRLRNALARLDQTDFSGFPEGTKDRVKAHLEMHAEALLYGNKEESASVSGSPLLARAYPCASSILSYVENATKDVQLRAKLERQADSILLVAENQGRDEEAPIVALRSALERLRK